MNARHFDRRRFLIAGTGCLLGRSLRAADNGKKALIAITLDLEMSRNFPTWDQTEWDYEKGNLNAETKRYAVEACRRVKTHDGVVHCFAVGRVLEQPDVGWLKEIAAAGHPVGNHTYDHVNVKATRPDDVQFRFRRAPWLIEGRAPRDVIRENIRLTSAALKARAGIEAAGFRTPGGFADGLSDRPDLRRMLRELGFRWVSSKYPAHPLGDTGKQPSRAVLDAVVKAQEQAQPFAYPDSLVEVPMSQVSDISAFRGGRWKLPWFLDALRLAVEWAIDRRATFDFLGHPSCLYVVDPEFRAIELICTLVEKAGNRAKLVNLGSLAERVANRAG